MLRSVIYHCNEIQFHGLIDLLKIDMHTNLNDDFDFSFTSASYTGTEVANGEMCTASNACTSNLCVQCPGDTSASCYTRK